jgi:hypothetical protein
MRPAPWGVTWWRDGWFPGYLTEDTDDRRALKMPLGKLRETISAAMFKKGGGQ